MFFIKTYEAWYGSLMKQESYMDRKKVFMKHGVLGFSNRESYRNMNKEKDCMKHVFNMICTIHINSQLNMKKYD
jgi:hypothetical protein